MSKLPKIYVENPKHVFSPPRLPPEVFAAVSPRFIKVSTDAMIVDRSRQTIYPAKRTVDAMAGWWFIGGSILPGESWLSSMQRVFERDTKLRLKTERFQFVMQQRHQSAVRDERPKDLGEDCIAVVFAVELNDSELKKVAAGIDRQRYAHFMAFDRNQLVKEGVRSAVLDFYDVFFAFYRDDGSIVESLPGRELRMLLIPEKLVAAFGIPKEIVYQGPFRSYIYCFKHASGAAFQLDTGGSSVRQFGPKFWSSRNLEEFRIVFKEESGGLLGEFIRWLLDKTA